MDWDQVVIRSLDDLRNYDATVVIFFHNTQSGNKISCADPEGGAGVPDTPPEKSRSFMVSYQHWSRSPVNLQSDMYMYQASIQFLAIIGPPGERHLNGVRLAGGFWSSFSGI